MTFPLSFTTSDFAGKTITKVIVNASANVESSLSVTVGGKDFGTSQTLTSTQNNYTFEGSEQAGDIVIKYTSSSTGRAYLRSISVTFSEGGSTPDPELADAGLSFPQAQYSANLGEYFEKPTLRKATDAAAVYSSTVESVATVNPSTGVITLVAAGTTTIKAKTVATKTHKAGEASYTLTVNDPNAPKLNLITSAAELEAAEYIIFVAPKAKKVANNTNYANNRKASNIVVSSDMLTVTPTDDMLKFTVGKDGDKYTFKTINYSDPQGYLGTQGYLGNTANKNYATINATIAEGRKATVTFSTTDNTATVVFANTNVQQYFQYNGTDNNNSLFSCYNGVKTDTGYEAVAIYGPAAVKTDWEPALENMSLTIGENKSVNLGSAHPSNISYQVAPADVASVDDNGTVTALKAGNATITLTWGDEPRYNSGTTSFNLTVSKKTYHFPVATVSVEKGKTLSILPNNGPQNITYASADENIFTVSEAGVITGVAVGNANVNVSWTEDDNFLSGNATVAVTVKEPQQAGSVGFSRDAIRSVVDYPVSWQVAHVTGDGAVTYSATPAGIVTLNAATGEITSVNAEGTVTITATMAETEAYTGATASYTITVEKNPEAVNLSGGTATFDFSQKNAYGMYTYNSSTTGDTADALGKMEGDRPDSNPAVTSITEGAVTLGIEGNYRLFDDYWNNDGSHHYELRMYEGNPALTLTFTGNGSKIKSITFADADARSFSNNSTDGSIAVGVVDGKTTKFTYATPVSEAVYILSTSEARVETATITVELEGESKAQPGMTFGENYTNLTVGSTYDGMAGGSGNGYDKSLIKYSVDEGTADSDYLIIGSGEEFIAEFYTPGVYTIRASYPGNDATVAGQAVMRVNVFPKLTVESEEALEKGFNTSENAYAIVPHGSEKDVTIAGVPLTVKLYKGNSEHNGILNVADESHTVVMKYAGKDEFKSPEQTLHVVVRPATPEITEDNKLTVASGHSIYYRKADDMANAPYKAESTEVPAFDLTGWTQYTADGIAKPTVKTYYKGIAVNDGHAMTAANKNVAGNEMSFIIDPAGVITGIENVAVDGSEAPVRYYNLQGVQLPAAPAAGFYLEVQGSRATKRLAR